MTIKKNLKNRLLLPITIAASVNINHMCHGQTQYTPMHACASVSMDQPSVINDLENDFMEGEAEFFIDKKPETPAPAWKLWLQNGGIYILNQYLELKESVQYYMTRAKKIVLMRIKRLYAINKK